MLTINSSTECQKKCAEYQLANQKITIVPTMGALHQGHLSLVKIAKQHASKVVLTIFVNPLQFNSKEDLEKYPRILEQDSTLAAQAGVDLLFAPLASEILPKNIAQHTVRAGEASKGFEGKFRPGHFDGVTTIVSILFDIVQPDFAIFGEKDFQQLKVIEEMVAAKQYNTKIISAPIIREDDGLAMSSRNMRLSPEQRQRAQAIPKALNAAKDAARRGEKEAVKLCEIAQKILKSSGINKIDYIAVVDENLKPLTSINSTARIIFAGSIDDIRLIDNLSIAF